MKRPDFLPFTPHRVAAAAASAVLGCAAHAQTTPSPAPSPSSSAAAPANPDDSLKLDAVVITGTSTQLSKMKQSVSVSTLDADQIERTGAASAAELLRSIPGLRSESSGGEGNANITVRGVPISAGGARYVQLQEDGLPILLFGDIAFGTADQFLRADYNVDRLEVVRGGSASTLASNSPGGIVNFISKTGEEAGGAVGLSFGHPTEYRIDADYGGSLGPRTTFHVGGFGRIGEGGRLADFHSAKGGQLRANVTQQFDAGYLRASLKALDDRTPTFLPVPVRVVNGSIQQIANVDPRNAFLISDSFTRDRVLTRDGSFTDTDPRDGLRIKSLAIGAEGAFTFGDGWSVSDKLRKSFNSGRFIGMFPSDNGNNGNGFAAPTMFTGVLFNSKLDNFDNLFNELRLGKTLNFGSAGKGTVAAGLFTGTQNVAETWFWNRYDVQLTGRNPQVVDAAGLPTAAPIGDGFTTFGGCCVRNWSVQYKQVAPFLALTYEWAGLNVDASVRHDRQSADGTQSSGDPVTRSFGPATTTINGNLVNISNVDYDVSHTSWSAGANYGLTKDLSVFGRASDGVSFSADRLLYGNPLNGSVPISLNKVRQYEAGAKWRNAPFSLFATFFEARTNESNYEVTTQTFTSNEYKARGLELEAAWRWQGFRVNGGVTYTHSRIESSNDPATVGKKPRRQADFVWQLTPSYGIASLDVGAAIVGTTKSYGDDANTITMDGFTVVNPYVSYQINPKLSVAIAANNVFNKLGYTEVEGDGHAARAVNGRTYRATLKYQF